MTDRRAMDPEAMRASGYAAIDTLVELLHNIDDMPALTRATPTPMRARTIGPAPEGPTDVHGVLERLARDWLHSASRTDHPRYPATVPTGGAWHSALDDLIVSALTISGGAWRESAGPRHLEEEVVRWFAESLRFPAEAGGVLMAGRSAANLAALACAREVRLGAMRTDAVAYVSDQSHPSVARAARILGFTPAQVRILPVDDRFRLSPDVVAAAIAADREAGLHPLLVSAAAGSTTTGAVDPLDEVADVCGEQDVWLHVDGANAGVANLTEPGRRRLEGIARADSVTLDPHRWLDQPGACGCLIVRDARHLDAFAMEPDQLHDRAADQEDERGLCDRETEPSRSARSLKLWLGMQAVGLDTAHPTIDTRLDLASQAEQQILEEPELELLNPASLGITCFRKHPAGIDDEEQLDAINAALVTAYADSGEGLVSSTRLRGKYAVRLCVLDHSTTAADIASTLDWFATAGDPALAAAREELSPDDHLRIRDPDAGAVWARPTPSLGALQALDAVPLFAELRQEQRAEIGRASWTVEAEVDQIIVRRFESSREFYVVVAGELDVLGEDDRLLNQLGAGDVFGEIAALEWGSGYGYPRLATVVARTPARLLAVPAAALNDLLRQAPAVDARIRRMAQERAGRV